MLPELIHIKQLSSDSKNFDLQLDQLLEWESDSTLKIDQLVSNILIGIRRKGDDALIKYTRKFDGRDISDIEELVVSREEMREALDGIKDIEREALAFASKRILDYHQHQKLESWSYSDADGTLLGQQITPLGRVGIYVPGGKASYPSSVLMNALPAKVAGVGEIVMTVPAPRGELSPLVLAAAAIAGVDQIFTLGGAQAIGALAYGTKNNP